MLLDKRGKFNFFILKKAGAVHLNLNHRITADGLINGSNDVIDIKIQSSNFQSEI